MVSVRFELGEEVCEVEVKLRVDQWMGGGEPLWGLDGESQNGPASIAGTGRVQ